MFLKREIVHWWEWSVWSDRPFWFPQGYRTCTLKKLAELVTLIQMMRERENVSFSLLLTPISWVAFHPKAKVSPAACLQAPILLAGCCDRGAGEELWAFTSRSMLLLRQKQESHLQQQPWLTCWCFRTPFRMCYCPSQRSVDPGPVLMPHSLTVSLPGSPFA